MKANLICVLFGHKTVYHAVTGDIMEITSALTGNLERRPVTKPVRCPFCLRCGNIVHTDTPNKE